MAHHRTGLQAKVVAEFNKDPVKLYTITDVMELFDIDKIAAQNALYNAHRAEKIKKHKEKNEKGQLQFALEIPDHLNNPYVMGTANRSKIKSHKIKKGQMPSSREIRAMFAQTQNQMAKMEDMMIAVVEEAEELEKMMTKIRAISG